MAKRRRRAAAGRDSWSYCPACRDAARRARTLDVVAEMRAWHTIDERPEWWARLLHRTGGTVAA